MGPGVVPTTMGFEGETMRALKWAAVMTLTSVSVSAVAASTGESLAQLTSTLSGYLATLAGTSALVVALLEAYKKLLSVRGKYHRTAIMRWLAQDSTSITGELALAKPGILSAVALGGGNHYAVPDYRKVMGKDYSPEQAYAEFFHLTSGQSKPATPHPSHAIVRWRSVDRAVFELETSRMMSQVQDAADAVLNGPQRYPHLYAFLTRGVDASDAAAWLAYMSSPPASGPTKQDSDRYARIRMLMRRQLDAFQTVTTCRWDDLNQWWAMLLGAVILFIALVIGADPQFVEKPAFDPWESLKAGWRTLSDPQTSVLGLLLKAALGGVLAPIGKDLLNSISSIKFSR
ncbi:hypothetical protein A4W93_20150 [Piscinibacter gummiphilus]|uniref:Uncharacterized protein n=2 Tax=Piscinibacter gummiphilus TaxID=946333 RepID=A0A1W6LCR9_9BURK|nr:hypothetical protein A4W93_20150 [Piscinibacter gummiphilus]ATU66708.1 hypothetical protein CPZ87_20245 [Piscinibacter gummiphilus]GLS94101.1 hypothetical protein GCM10007918_13930 [Piscinibacter gummiphilus]